MMGNREAQASAIQLVTLEELDRIDPPALVSLAVHVGQARLIDNIVLGETDA